MTDVKKTPLLFKAHPAHIAIFSFLSLVYASCLSRYTNISTASQFIIIIYVLLLVSLNSSKYFILFFLLLFFLFIDFQGIYSLSYVAIIASIPISRTFDEKITAYITISYCLIFSFLSITYFYFDFEFLYTPIHYDNFLFFLQTRLTGLDGSPAYLSFISGMGLLLSLFFVRARFLSVALAMFFAGVVLLTASRTAAIGLILGALLSLLRGGGFSVAVGALSMSPLAATLVYCISPNLSTNYLVEIELITSHRVINWANLLIYFSNLDVTSMLFGIGKPATISDPAILQSATKTYLYLYVNYAESSILRIFFYNGAVLYTLFISYIVLISFHINDYGRRVFFIYFIFSAIYYDAIFSIQYIHLSMIFFCLSARGLRRKNLQEPS